MFLLRIKAHFIKYRKLYTFFIIIFDFHRFTAIEEIYLVISERSNAMIQLELLWKLQCIDKKIAETKKRIKDKETYDRLVGLKNRYNEVKETLNKDNVELDENNRKSLRLNSDLKYMDDKIKVNNEKIYNSSSSMKIVNSLEKENDRFKEKVDTIENELLSLLDAHETLVSRMEEDKKLQEKLKKEFDELKSMFKKNGEKYGKVLESLESERINILKEVDRDLYNKYNDIASKKTNPVSMVKNSVCTECGYRLNSSLLDNLKKQKQVIECEYCGRILYLEE